MKPLDVERFLDAAAAAVSFTGVRSDCQTLGWQTAQAKNVITAYMRALEQEGWELVRPEHTPVPSWMEEEVAEDFSGVLDSDDGFFGTAVRGPLYKIKPNTESENKK